MLNIQHNKPTKHQKNKKKKTFKVVYINTPMKVKTSASEFRALVQELTGQDADVSKPHRRLSSEEPGEGFSGDIDRPKAKEDGGHVLKVPPVCEPDFSWEAYHDDVDDDHVLMPQIVDNFQGLVSADFWHGPVLLNSDPGTNR